MVNIRSASLTSRVMVVAIMVSMVAFLDSTVVNLALPATERDLGGGLSLQQWVVDGYLLALAAMILPGGSISDVVGRVAVMRFGLVAFGTGSVLAASAVSSATLITGRIIQGLGAAFLVPSSLALINSAFDREHQPAAIGTWTAWTGTAFALGPLLGGLAVDHLNWRWIYVLSAIPMVLGFALTFWLCPMPGPSAHSRVDLVGVALSAAGVTATIYALIESQWRGWTDPMVVICMVIGVVALTAFVGWQRHSSHPMLPLSLFSSRDFLGANVVTAFVYGGLILGSLAITLFTQEVAGYSATVAGLVTLPIPVMSFLFARHAGTASARVGPRILLMAGSALAGFGLLVIDASAERFPFVGALLPGITLLAIGLVCTVTPLTSVTLASVGVDHSGIASAIQNAAGRLSSLIAVGCMGLITGGTLTHASFGRLMQVGAGLFFLGGIASSLAIGRSAMSPEPVSCEVAALCRDRIGAQPALASRS